MEQSNLITFDDLERISPNHRNQVLKKDLPIHRWYRFILSFPPHLVRHYTKQFDIKVGETVLDPFCGTGTTLVECKKLGIPSIGIESNPIAHFASEVKTDWNVSPGELWDHAVSVYGFTEEVLNSEGLGSQVSDHDENDVMNHPVMLRTLSEEQTKLLIKGSISPIPLHRTIRLLEAIEKC